MSALNVYFAEQGRTIEVQADLREGWDRGPRTYQFSREDNIQCKADIGLRVSLKVYPRPCGLGRSQELFPASLSASGVVPIPFQVCESSLSFQIPLIREGVNFDLPWGRTKNNKFGFWWNNLQIGQCGQLQYTAQLLVVIQRTVPTFKPIDWVKAEKGVFSSLRATEEGISVRTLGFYVLVKAQEFPPHQRLLLK